MNAEQQKLREDLTRVFEKNIPFKTVDAIEVLTFMLGTLIVTNAHNKTCAGNVVSTVATRLEQMLDLERWPEEQRKH